MVKRIFILFIFLNFVSHCFAERVNEPRAIKIAEICISGNSSNTQNYLLSKIEKIITNQSFLYIVEFNPTGFVVLSGDDRFYPVLYYSTESNYNVNDIPPGFKMMMDNYSEQLNYTIKNYTTATVEVKTAWLKYENKETAFQKTNNVKAVLPLIQTKWHQTYPYNIYCPKVSSGGSGGMAYAGCEAVALAQLMKYYEKPEYGNGSNKYKINFDTIWADFSSKYDWLNIVTTLQNETDTAKINETAKLIYHAGVAVITDYNGISSGAIFSDAYLALSNYFYYFAGSYIDSKSSYSDDAWLMLIKNDLDNKRPVLYRASDNSGKGGHVFLVDGYNDNNYLHVNWGWGGSFNGYYLSESLTPGNYNFCNGNQMFIGVKPFGLNPEITYPSNNCQDFNVNSLIKWIYKYTTDSNTYRIILAFDSCMKNIVIDQIIKQEQYCRADNLKYSSQYYLKIGAVNKDTIFWSDMIAFKTEKDPNIYSIINYNFPAKGAILDSLSTMISLSCNSNSISDITIRLQVARDYSFQSIIYDEIVPAKNILNIFVDRLNFNRCYYWRAGSYRSNNTFLGWNEYNYFYTKNLYFKIYNNYPNPFNSKTIIKFEIPQKGFISIKISDDLGREIETLVNSYLDVSNYTYEWKPKNIASGIYFCKIKFNDIEKIIKLNYLK
jgi:hypothetical protein